MRPLDLGQEPHVVPVRWYPRDERVRASLQYIVHREEALPGGRPRTLHGIGDRYRNEAHDEAAVEQLLMHDGRDLAAARYYRLKLTVNDQAAAALQALPFHRRERAFRAAVRDLFADALPLAQGVFVLHSHSRGGRPHGHPHAHVHLGPRRQGGGAFAINRRQLATVKTSWASAIAKALTQARVPTITVGLGRAQSRGHGPTLSRSR